MTIQEYKSCFELDLATKKKQLEDLMKEIPMAEARVQVIDDMIAHGIEFKEEATDVETTEDAEVEVIAETATDESY